ncbi:hypothetical protein CAMSH0001_2029 [Campylobacter showae RM3277]|uniref:Uncharacterized protein n=1 Tax=Campylobacter showae RM3277 TaxID=553219 RepID=C6RED7_9BACT|nr:hypothetical protein CAMSH0001_2029 [Campylobacter showae RM3277]
MTRFKFSGIYAVEFCIVCLLTYYATSRLGGDFTKFGLNYRFSGDFKNSVNLGQI